MFIKATKKKCKARIAITGVTGAGKTYSALRIAQGLGDKIAFLDTERRSASKYSDRFNFDVAEVEQAKIDKVIEVINGAGQAGYDVLIIDSLTHAWQELLADIDKLAKTKYKGNSFQAWGEGTPRQKQLVNAILDSPCHVIATMRAKMEYSVDIDSKTGKRVPTKIGLGAEQGKGIEYEFDMLLEISQEHVAQVTKDRTGKFQDALIEYPDEQLGKDIKAWLDDGEIETNYKKQESPKAQSKEEVNNFGKVNSAKFKAMVSKHPEVEQQIKKEFNVSSTKDFDAKDADKIFKRVQELKAN